jgi:hypothetical protein
MPDEDKRKDYFKVAKLLSGEETTDINARDDAGRTAYFWAACMGMVEILDFCKGVKYRDPYETATATVCLGNRYSHVLRIGASRGHD